MQLPEARAFGHKQALFVPALLAVGVLALAMRAWEMADKSIWLDEAWSWRAARLPLSSMVDWTAQDKHPPLYYGVLHYWTDAFGDGEAALRMPSALAGALAAALLAAAGWRAGGAKLGVLAGVLLAVHRTAVEFAQEARMYPLEGLLSLASSIALAALIDRPSSVRVAAYAALALAAVYTHYSGFMLLGVHAMLIAGYAISRFRADRGGRVAVAGGVALAIVAAGYAPWYPHMLESARAGVGHLPDPNWQLADLVFSALMGLQRAEDLWLAIAFPAVGLGLWGVWRRRSDPYAVAVAAIALAPVIQLAYSVVRSPVFDVRQASPYIPGFAFLLALGLVELGDYVADTLTRKRLMTPVAATGGGALVALMLVACGDWYGRGPREDWRAAAAEIEGVAGPVYIWRGYIDEPLRYYSDRTFTTVGPQGDLVLPETRAAATLVLSHHTPDEEQAILRTLSAVYDIGEPQSYAGITVYPLSPR